ncbi:hypothetical protein EES47_12100 [Streptomyces sp. ADI98-12]|nr:hypothetical protein EES47_12100 [Streptomyces sp. ADI98-12]
MPRALLSPPRRPRAADGRHGGRPPCRHPLGPHGPHAAPWAGMAGRPRLPEGEAGDFQGALAPLATPGPGLPGSHHREPAHQQFRPRLRVLRQQASRTRQGREAVRVRPEDLGDRPGWTPSPATSPRHSSRAVKASSIGTGVPSSAKTRPPSSWNLASWTAGSRSAKSWRARARAATWARGGPPRRAAARRAAADSAAASRATAPMISRLPRKWLRRGPLPPPPRRAHRRRPRAPGHRPFLSARAAAACAGLTPPAARPGTAAPRPARLPAGRSGRGVPRR